MSTIKRGAVAETAVLAALVRRGFAVFVPFLQTLPFDLLVEAAPDRFVRVQCKNGWVRDECIIFNTCSTDHGEGRQDYRGRADVFAIYSPPLDAVYLLPVADAPTRAGRLRLGSPRNNQRAGVRFAHDFHIDRWTPEALAAVVEPPAAAVAC